MRVLVVEDDAAVRTTDRDAPRVRRLRGGCGFFDREAIERLRAGDFPVVISDIYLTSAPAWTSRGRAGA